ncbi:sugar phosphate isomerase/epimerase family protein [Candidatus Latescibacterota bacterium]
MTRKFSRRQMLTAGAVSAGMIMKTGCTSNTVPEQKTERGPGREAFWGPGVDQNIVRDLTPGQTPVRMGGFLGSIEDVDLTETVKKKKEGGLTAVVTRGEWINELTGFQLSELNAALENYDVVISAVTGNRYTNFIHPDTAIRQKYLKNLAKFIEIAEKVNCPAVPTICGTRAPETPQNISFKELFTKEYRYNVHPGNWSLETWKLLVASIKQVLKDTSGMKASIAMEAQVTTTIDGPLAHRRLIDDVGDPRLGVELDPVNMISLHNYYHTTELLNECFGLLGEHILTCHAKDTYILPNRQTVHVQEVCAGRGVMDYETYIVRMSRLNWPRMLLPEHIPADQFPEAYAYIRKVANRVGVKIYE